MSQTRKAQETGSIPLQPKNCRAVDDKQQDYEERAAIMEFEGGLPRDQAEREAHWIVYGKSMLGGENEKAED